MSLTELQEKRGRLMTQAREALNEINANTDEARSAELEARHDSIMCEFDALERKIEREERMTTLEKRFADRQAEERAKKRPNGGDGETRGQDDGEAVEYREVFYKFLAGGADIGELSAEERSVLKAGVQSAKEFRTQVTTSGGPGGYTVPVELADIIVRSMKDWGPMYSEDVATVISTAGGNQINLPTVDDRPLPQSSTRKATPSAIPARKTLPSARSGSTIRLRYGVREVLDGTGAGFHLQHGNAARIAARRRLGRIANRELTIGDGTGDPNGVVTASSLGKTAAATAAITADEIIDLLHSVNAAYRRSPKARFMFADTTLAAIRKLKDGDGNYLWSMGDVQKGEPGTLLGYRYSINDDMASLGAAAKVMLFGDFSKYFVRKVGSPVIGVLRERFWPDLGIAGLIRFDGELGDTAAVKHLITAAV